MRQAWDAGVVVFWPRRRRPALWAALTLAVAAGLAAWVVRGGVPHDGVLRWPARLQAGAGLAAAFAAFGLAQVLTVALRYPRLLVDADGLVLEGRLWRHQVDWGELSPLSLRGPADAPNYAVSHPAPVATSVRRRRRVVLRPVYTTPLGDIVALINGRLAMAPPGPPRGRPVAGWSPGMPWLSLGLAGLLAAIYVLELRYPATEPGVAGPSRATLLAFGGMSAVRVLGEGEWFRLFTVALLHLSETHLVLNGVTLLLGGYYLEALLGRAWFLLALCAGGVGGSLLSLATGPADMVSVGASGAIVGLFVAGLMASLRLPPDLEGRQLRFRMLLMLVPTLGPWFAGRADPAVDNAGHFGGALGGALVAIALWQAWPPTQPRVPRGRRVMVAAGLACAVYGAAAAAAALDWEGSPFRRLLPAPPEAANLAEAASLARRFPEDPRALVERARFELRGDPAASARDYQAAYDLAGRLRPYFPAAYQVAVGGRLALVLHALHRDDEAAAPARQACQAPSPGSEAAVLAELRQQGLCPR